MCKCNKGVPANRSPIVSGAFAMSNGNFRYTNNDFVVKYYVGETGNYTGSSTGIDYGLRTYNAKTMVHTADYEADGNLFSDTEQVEQEVPEEIVMRSEKANEVPSNETLSHQLDVLTSQIDDYKKSQVPAELVTFEENADKKETLVKPKKDSKKKGTENVENENTV